jgi:nucleoside-diphosphate-sugar epimerase
LAEGHELWLLNRGRSVYAPAEGARVLHANARDEEALAKAVGEHEWDSVVEWIAYTPADVVRDLRVFEGRTRQYIFISSASVYQKPPSHWLITESTPLRNPFWKYSQDKISCEHLLAGQSRVPWTVVRPSHTYGPSQVPIGVGSWEKPYTVIDRMRRGAPVIVPGDGTSLWTVTHNSDFARGFVGLLGREEALGEAFHITSDEALSWGQIYRAVAGAAGAEANLLTVPTDAIAAADPASLGGLWGDKSHSAVFDNAKIRSLVPGFKATVPLADGIRATIAWFDADPARRAIDEAANALWDRLAAVYQGALRDAGALAAQG